MSQQRTDSTGNTGEGHKSPKAKLVWRPKSLNDVVDRGAIRRNHSHKDRPNNQRPSTINLIPSLNNPHRGEVMYKSTDPSKGFSEELKRLTLLGKEIQKALWTPQSNTFVKKGLLQLI